MKTSVTHNPNYPSSERAQRTNDILLISSFALWAMLIGFAPVVTFRLLMS